MKISKSDLETDLSIQEIEQTFSEEFEVKHLIGKALPNVIEVSIVIYDKFLKDRNDIKFQIYFILHQPANKPNHIKILKIIVDSPIDKYFYISTFCLTKLKTFCSIHCINQIDIPTDILRLEKSSAKNDSENKQLETDIKNLLDSENIKINFSKELDI